MDKQLKNIHVSPKVGNLAERLEMTAEKAAQIFG